MWSAAPSWVISTTVPRTTSRVYGSAWSLIDIATRGSRRMLSVFTRPSAVFTTIVSPSTSTQTTLTCGDPSGINVAKWP